MGIEGKNSERFGFSSAETNPVYNSGFTESDKIPNGFMNAYYERPVNDASAPRTLSLAVRVDKWMDKHYFTCTIMNIIDIFFKWVIIPILDCCDYFTPERSRKENYLGYLKEGKEIEKCYKLLNPFKPDSTSTEIKISDGVTPQPKPETIIIIRTSVDLPLPVGTPASQTEKISKSNPQQPPPPTKNKPTLPTLPSIVSSDPWEILRQHKIF